MAKQFKYESVFTFEPETFRIITGKKDIKLSHKEAAVFLALCENTMHVVERRVLLNEVWGANDSSDIGFNKCILLLRRKLESIGLDEAIETIPRIGYTLRLKVLEVNESDILPDNVVTIEGSKASEYLITLNEKVKNQFFFISIFTVVVVLLIYSYNSESELMRSEEYKNIRSITKIKESTQGRTVLYTRLVKSPSVYTTLLKLIKKERQFYVLVSDRALSYIDIDSNQGVLWQKTFMLDNMLEIPPQLECISNYINSYLPSDVDVKKIPGMIFTSLKFYRTCIAIPDYIGEVFIKTTYPADSQYESSTWTQDFTFINFDSAPLFHLKRVSRTHNINNESKYLSIKSISVDLIQQESLQLDKDAEQILNQFTKDEIYQVEINKNYRIHASTPFGGIIYYFRKFK